MSLLLWVTQSICFAFSCNNVSPSSPPPLYPLSPPPKLLQIFIRNWISSSSHPNFFFFSSKSHLLLNIDPHVQLSITRMRSTLKASVSYFIMSLPVTPLKGILHQKIFYRLNLIFWIVMGCGIARFSRRGLKTTETWKFWSQNLSPGVLRRGAPGVSRHSSMGCGGAIPHPITIQNMRFRR